jgi:DNA-binding Xre family transcriptional regulator
MIYSKVRELRFRKEEEIGSKLTYEVMQRDIGLNPNTLSRLLGREPIKRIDGDTLAALCRYFGVGVGDLLEYVPSAAPAEAAEASE